MPTWINKQKIAILILILAGIGLLVAVSYHWYNDRTEYFLSGTPPPEIFTRIEPKSVPYNQIKPPAFLQSDPLAFGSITSTIGIIFYGDYSDEKSNKFYNEIKDYVIKQKGRARLVWHYLPKTDKDGDVGFEAALLSECNRLIDDKWSAHELLLKTQSLKRSDLEILANQLMDTDNMLYACRKDKEIQDYVRYNIQLAKGDGIDVAPFVFVGTQVFPSQTSSTTEIIKSMTASLR